MPGSIFGIPYRPTSGQGVVWSETLGGRMDSGTLGQAASGLSGLTLNRVPFGNSLGGLQDSANLTFDGTTLALTGAATISTTLGVTGVSTLTGGFAATAQSSVVIAGATVLILTNTNAGAANAGAGISARSDPGAALTTGNRLGHFTFAGAKDASHTIANPCRFEGLATENWSSTATGTKLAFYTCANTTTAAAIAMTLDQDQSCILSGALQLGNAYVATPQVTTGYVTLKDSTGTTYKVLVAT